MQGNQKYEGFIDSASARRLVLAALRAVSASFNFSKSTGPCSLDPRLRGGSTSGAERSRPDKEISGTQFAPLLTDRGAGRARGRFGARSQNVDRQGWRVWRCASLLFIVLGGLKKSAAGVCEICAVRSLSGQESERLVPRAQLRASVHPPCHLLGHQHSRSHTRVAECGVPTCVPSVLSN